MSLFEFWYSLTAKISLDYIEPLHKLVIHIG